MALKNKALMLEKELNIELFNKVVKYIFVNRDIKEDCAAFVKKLNSYILFIDDGMLYSTKVEKEIEKDYDIKYVGELFERYKEKGIVDKKDIRALALAFGFTNEIHTDTMFVADQKIKFIKEIYKQYQEEFDLYYALSLFFVLGEKGRQLILQDIFDRTYKNYAEISLLLSITDESELLTVLLNSFLMQFKDLFTIQRTIPVTDNERVYAFFISKLADVVKASRKKEMSFFKALCTLPYNRIHNETGHFKILKENGYSDKEIAYLNYFVPTFIRNKDCIAGKIGIYQKVAVDYCTAAINDKTALTEIEKEILECLLRKYNVFNIKCNGSKAISELLIKNCKIQNHDDYIWLINLNNNLFPKDSDFFFIDFLDDKNARLIKRLSEKQSLDLFNNFIVTLTEKEQMLLGIKMLEELTGIKYFEYLKSGEVSSVVFNILTNYEVIDLNGYLEELNKLDYSMKHLIYNYVKQINNKSAYNFIVEFNNKYGIKKFKNYFNYHLCEEFMRGYYYSNGTLSIKKIFDYKCFSTNEIKNIIILLSTSLFAKKPKEYVQFIKSLLEYNEIDKYFDKEELRTMCLILTKNKVLSGSSGFNIQEKYLQKDDLDKIVEFNNKQKEDKIAKSKKDSYLSMLKETKSKFNGTFESIFKILDVYWYKDYNYEILCFISICLCQELIRLCTYLSHKEFCCCCSIYLLLLKRNYISSDDFIDKISEAKALLSKKEDKNNV